MRAWRLLVLPSWRKVMPAKGQGLLTIVLRCLPILLLTALCVIPLSAQTNEGAPSSSPQSPQQNAGPTPQATPAHPAHSAHRRSTLDDRVQAFAKALDLTQPQQEAVKRILLQRQSETLRLRQDGSISGEERIGRLRALQDQTVQRIRAVLNDEQKKKYDPLAARERTPPQDQKTLEEWLKETTPKPAQPPQP